MLRRVASTIALASKTDGAAGVGTGLGAGGKYGTCADSIMAGLRKA